MSIINQKVYEHLDEIILSYNNLYNEPDNRSLKDKLIKLINNFDWNKFKNSIDYISHHRELILKKIKDLQQLQTGDLIEFDKLPKSCLPALNFQDAKGIKRSGSRSGSISRKRQRKDGSKIKNGKSRKKN
tara:strand:+ start:900 stop:1289 length:390 start_codon:yes stop_codon:yes gene_type:complete